MKEPVADFIRALPDSPSGAFVILGEEPQLIEEARTAIRSRGNFGSKERADLESLAESGIAADRGASLFGGGACLYEIVGHTAPRGHAAKESDADIEGKKDDLSTLVQFAERIAAPDVLVLALYGLERKHYKAAWLRDLGKHATVLIANRLGSVQTADWCRNWMTEWKLELPEDSINWLAAQTEGNLTAAKQCLQKILLCRESNGTVANNLSEVKDILSGGARYSIFRMTEEALCGQGRKALDILNVLLETQEPPPLILWTLTNAANGVLLVKRKQQPPWGLPAAQLREAGRRANESQIMEVILRAAHADRIVKGVEVGDIKTALIDTLLALAALKNNVALPTPKRVIVEE